MAEDLSPLPDQGHTVKDRLAKHLLPIEKCCGKGCRKCNYGRWLKHRPRNWRVLLDECLKRMPPWMWGIGLLLAYIAGYAAR
jgi:hypothetical protein